MAGHEAIHSRIMIVGVQDGMEVIGREVGPAQGAISMA